jgi:hypothetical protein
MLIEHPGLTGDWGKTRCRCRRDIEPEQVVGVLWYELESTEPSN